MSTSLRSILSTMNPVNGAVRPMMRDGTVSTIGTSISAPGMPANSAAIWGSTGAMRTAPRTDRQLAASSTINCARPGIRDSAGVVVRVVMLVDGESDMVTPWFVAGPGQWVRLNRGGPGGIGNAMDCETGFVTRFGVCRRLRPFHGCWLTAVVHQV